MRVHNWQGRLLSLILFTTSGAAWAVDVELASTTASLSNGYPTQHGEALQLAWRGDSDPLLRLVFEHKQAFGEVASLVVGSIAQDITADDRVGFALAHSNAATILARTRIDAFYSRKLLSERNLVATLAGYSAQVADGHQDAGMVASAAWYLPESQVAEAGVRWARSNPGSNQAWRGFAGYTWGAVGRDTVALHAEAGHEAYQSLGANAAVADFTSEEVTFGWRHWLRPDAGFAIGVSAYQSPTYNKRTLSVTGFVSF